MFDIGADELLLTAVVAIVVIGPKDLPRALRTLGRWTAKMRRMSNAFRSGIENVIREAELEEMEKQWREQNAAIMAAHPGHSADTDAEAAAAASVGEVPALAHASADTVALDHVPADHVQAASAPAEHSADHRAEHTGDHPVEPKAG
jgi:sec-independent protein translocase protein TatB